MTAAAGDGLDVEGRYPDSGWEGGDLRQELVGGRNERGDISACIDVPMERGDTSPLVSTFQWNAVTSPRVPMDHGTPASGGGGCPLM